MKTNSQHDPKRKIAIFFGFHSISRELFDILNFSFKYILKCNVSLDAPIEEQSDAVLNILEGNYQFRQNEIKQILTDIYSNFKLDWIVDDDRQFCWLNTNLPPVCPEFDRYCHKYSRIEKCKLRIRGTIMGQKILLTRSSNFNLNQNFTFDTTIDINDLHNRWKKQLAFDKSLNWFTDKEEQSRRSFAFSYLIKMDADKFYGIPQSTHVDLLNAFDKIGFILDFSSKQLAFEKIKAGWARENYRKNNSFKKQINVMLSVQQIENLDQLATRYNFSRSEILSVLIKMETEHNAYIPFIALQKREL